MKLQDVIRLLGWVTAHGQVNHLLLSGELLTDRCHTDNLMPSIPVLCLPPSRVDLKDLGLNVLIYHSQTGGSWTTIWACNI